ncbi:MAG: glutathione S-transferase family protein [Octadecabacter sp.]
MLKLYHGLTSVCSVKARLTIAEIELDFDSVVLDLKKGEQFDPAYTRLNPSAVVPTLIDGDLIVVESSLIIEYLDRTYNGSRLMPTDAALQVRVRHWLLRCVAVHAAINTLTFATANRTKALATKTPEEIEASVAQLPDPVIANKRRDLYANGLRSVYVTQALLELQRTFRDMSDTLDAGAWVSGPEFGLADLGLLAYVDRLERLGFSGMWENRFPAIGTWLAAMQARQSYETAVEAFISESMAQAQRAGGEPHWPQLSQLWSDI